LNDARAGIKITHIYPRRRSAGLVDRERKRRRYRRKGRGWWNQDCNRTIGGALLGMIPGTRTTPAVGYQCHSFRLGCTMIW